MSIDIAQSPSTLYAHPKFNPNDYLTIKDNSNGTRSYYLEVKYRIMWFRLIYQLGKISVVTKHLSDNEVIAEATIYPDADQPEHNFLSRACAHKYKGANDSYDYVEWACTAAIGRALALAGFGQQFCDILEGHEPEMVDAPIVVPPTQETTTVQRSSQQRQNQKPQQQQQQQQPQQQYEPPYDESQMGYGDEIIFPDDPIGEEIFYDQQGQPTYIDHSNNQPPMGNNQVNTQPNTTARNNNNPPNSQNGTAGNYSPNTQNKSSGSNRPNNTRQQSAVLTFEECFDIKIDFGYNKGKTLGDLYSANDVNSLNWIAYTYHGNNQKAKAGACILLEALNQQQQAS